MKPIVRWGFVLVALSALACSSPSSSGADGATPDTSDPAEVAADTVPSDAVPADVPADAPPTDVAADGPPTDTGPADVGADPGGEADVCEPDCDNKECGDDGCGQSCGSCQEGALCAAGTCVCAAQDHKECCGDAVCWFDSCGEPGAQTAACPNGCAEAACLDCTADCADRECGDDGCGGDCGACSTGACDDLTWTPGTVCEIGQCVSGGAATSCDDALACTDDSCDAASGCHHEIQADRCLIDQQCFDEGELNPANACQACAPTTSPTGWTGIAEGTPCAGAACAAGWWTAPKTCVSGQCTGGGGSESCDDGKACTADACEAASGCGHTLQGGFCQIDAVCVPANQSNPTNACQACVPTTSPSAWSPANDGATCLTGSCSELYWFRPMTCWAGACSLGGSVQLCDDEIACTDDACDGQTGCLSVLGAGWCQIDGQCVADGAQNVADACQVCAPSTSATSWSTAADLTSCGPAGQVCQSGVCQLAELAGETCHSATPLTAGQTITGTTEGYAGNYGLGTNCSGTGGVDAVYSIVVPGGQRLTATVTPTSSVWDSSISLVLGPAANCDASPRVCLAGNDGGSNGNPDTVRYDNTSGNAQTIFVVIDTYSGSSPGGAFTLTAEVGPPPPTLSAGETCQLAPALTAGQPIEGSTTGLDGDYGIGTNCAGAYGYGPDGVYSILVPAGMRLTATVTPLSSWDPMISLVLGPAANCDASPLVCLTGEDDVHNDKPETVSYSNTSASDQTVFVVIGSDLWGPGGGAFTLTTAVTSLTLSPGDTCQAAPALTVGQDVIGSTAGYTGNYGTGTKCQGTAGLDGVYSVVVPGGKRLDATITPTGAIWNPSISLVLGPAANCDASPRVCLAGSDVNAGLQKETVGYVNTSGNAETVFIVIDSSSASVAGTFELTTALSTPPLGDTCQTAQALATGQEINESTTGCYSDYGSGTNCSGGSGLDRAYSFVVPGGKRLAATVTPTGTSWDPSISLVLGPAANCDASPRVCLAGADEGGAGEQDTVYYANTSGNAETVFIVIDAYSSIHAGTFSLTTALTNAP